MRRSAVAFATFAILLSTALTAWAGATTLSVSGEVRVSTKDAKPERLAEGQRVESGAAIKTGPNSEATIRFDDGQMVALTSNSDFKVDDYRFNPHKPETGGIFLSLIRGGMRTVTGLIGKAKPEEVKIKTAVATIGIRGTDFQIFVDRQMYVSVREGAISASNRAGEAVFDSLQQKLGLVSDSDTKPRTAEFSEFSTDAIAAMRRLDIEPNFGTRRPNQNDPTCADRR